MPLMSNREAVLDKLRREALKVRRNSWRALHAAGIGHVGGALSIADLMGVLFSKKINFKEGDPYFEDRDRFILSKGHAGAAVYAVLEESGFFSINFT